MSFYRVHLFTITIFSGIETPLDTLTFSHGKVERHFHCFLCFTCDFFEGYLLGTILNLKAYFVFTFLVADSIGPFLAAFLLNPLLTYQNRTLSTEH